MYMYFANWSLSACFQHKMFLFHMHIQPKLNLPLNPGKSSSPAVQSFKITLFRVLKFYTVFTCTSWQPFWSSDNRPYQPHEIWLWLTTQRRVRKLLTDDIRTTQEQLHIVWAVTCEDWSSAFLMRSDTNRPVQS